MKSIFTILLLLAGAQAQADVCTKHIACGTFEGSGQWYDKDMKPIPDTKFLETLSVRSVDSTTVEVEDRLYGEDRQPDEAWQIKARFVFRDNGQYDVVDSKGVTRASGVCREMLCTFDFFPWKGKDGNVTGNVNILRFENGKVYRHLMVTSAADDLHFQKSELTKK